MSGRILLHICCGPCAVYPISILREKGFEVMGVFFNPNVHPLKEYQRRAHSAIKAGKNLGIRVIALHSEYNPEKFLRQMVFREEQRCILCYQMRLERTRNMALKGGFDFFTSTLLFSKRQKHGVIKSLGESLDGSKCAFLYEDFRTGWARGRKMALDMDLYRQNYCGCIYSEFERFKNELQNDDSQALDFAADQKTW